MTAMTDKDATMLNPNAAAHVARIANRITTGAVSDGTVEALQLQAEDLETPDIWGMMLGVRVSVLAIEVLKAAGVEPRPPRKR